MKICKKCNSEKTSEEFHKDSSMPDGLTRMCKMCKKEIDASRYLTNANKLNKQTAIWRAENSCKKRLSDEKYRNKNRESRRKQTAGWKLANPEAVRAQKSAYRARKYLVGGCLSKDIVDRLYKLQRGKCVCCNQNLENDYHVDHIIPLSRGGENSDSNVQLLRSKCNMQKHAQDPIDFMQSRGFLI